MFKKRRGIKLPYKKQGLIYFTCLDIRNQPQTTQEKIESLCEDIGGEYKDALYEVMTSERSVRSIALDRYVSESTLYALRKKFYEAW